MTRTLESLIKEANSAFSGNIVLQQYRLEASTKRPSQLLAQYLVAEMRDLYGLESSDYQNSRRIASNLDMASARLEDVARYLRELHKSSLT